MSPHRLASAILLSGTALAAQGTSSATLHVDVPKIAFTRFSLPNGLAVILSEDHSLPIVAVDICYHVGAKDDPVDRRGFAHLFEHAMFSGSGQVKPDEHARIVQAGGGTYFAATADDRTDYWEEGPSNMLETYLWLEADRMSSLLVPLDSAKFELQKASIVNEYGLRFLARQTTGVPGQQPQPAMFAMTASLFPEPGPYHTPPIGDMREMKRASVADVRAFFSTYYVPNNATLVVVGDFAAAGARRLIEKYFNGIPRAADVTHPSFASGPLPEQTRVALEDHVAPSRQLWVGWRGVSARNPDRLALVALSSILSEGRSSRLGRALITGSSLATALPPAPYNGHFDLEEMGIFDIVATPAANASLTTIEGIVDSVVAQVQRDGVSADELRRWVAGFGVSSLVNQQRYRSVAGMLADGAVTYGDPLMELRDIERAERLTPSDIRRVANTYLSRGRVVLSIVPAGRLDQVSRPELPYRNFVIPGK